MNSVRTDASVRYAPALRQSFMSQSNMAAAAGTSGHGIVLVRQNAGGSFTQQRPLLPTSSLVLPPRVLRP